MTDNPYWNESDQSRFDESSDPIVTGDFSSWWNAGINVVQRSWRSMGTILLIGVAIPGFVLNLLNTLAYQDTESGMFDMGAANAETYDPGAALGFSLLAILLLYLYAAATMAATRTAAADAAGGFVTTSEALKAAFRVGWKLWLWMVLGYLCVSIGLVLLVVPGLLVAFGLAVIVPAATFQKNVNPFARSFALTYTNFGPALGRVVVTVIIAAVINCLISVFMGFLADVFLQHAPVAIGNIMAVVLSALTALLMLIPMLWMTAANLCTYAALRGRSEAISAVSLSSEATDVAR
ncbi:hypothetical protein [Haloglycomyces albus]|uniref:hypothetical protein n=1 Tax=Haloglycomyces albus TaxID=526067 RepID=UPI00046D28C1|nr:hypothetical protein [Haloglycomyces albus]